MPSLRPDALALTRIVLRALIVLNGVAGVVFLGLLVWFLSSEDEIRRIFEAVPDSRISSSILRVRTFIMILIGSVPLAHVVLRRLLAIVQTVGLGDPFVSDNAARLRVIAWALLGMQVLQMVGGALLMTRTRNSMPQSTLSLTPWVAVLLLFVLARVFQRGTQMREDLAGTV